MNNPILNEIPDVCISDEMREQIINEKMKEERNRRDEIQIVRKNMSERYTSPLNYSEDVRSLATQYFLDLSSTELLDTFLSHFVAYSYCLEKAAQKRSEL